MTASLMESLKESTAPMHNSAEGSRFQSLLTNGKLPLEVYADYLGQLFLVHSHLEDAMRNHASCAKVLTNEQYQVEFLKKDLTVLGRETSSVSALASTRSLLDLIAAAAQNCPEALLGMHYVLLGSKHGGKFVAKNVQVSYALEDGAGNTYFDPYGNSFMPIWRQFKDDMNKLELPPQTADTVCKAAADMFRHITMIGDELMPVVSGSQA